MSERNNSAGDWNVDMENVEIDLWGNDRHMMKNKTITNQHGKCIFSKKIIFALFAQLHVWFRSISD